MTRFSRGRTAALMLLFALMGVSAQAATFRCGNVYQDKPCEGKEAEKQLLPGQVPNAVRPSPSCPAIRKRLDAVNAESRIKPASGAATNNDLPKRRAAVEKEMVDGRC
jgi:hypothetical protein